MQVDTDIDRGYRGGEGEGGGVAVVEHWTLILGSLPWCGRVRQFFCPNESTLAASCLCLTPFRVYGMHPNHMCTLKIKIYLL